MERRAKREESTAFDVSTGKKKKAPSCVGLSPGAECIGYKCLNNHVILALLIPVGHFHPPALKAGHSAECRSSKGFRCRAATAVTLISDVHVVSFTAVFYHF